MKFINFFSLFVVIFLQVTQIRKYRSLIKFCFDFDRLESLTSGFTCDSTVNLSCSSGKKLVILEVIYAAECPRDDEKVNGTSIYAPSRCIGYLSESIREQCQGQETCQIDHSLEHRPQFLKNQSEKSNCDFKGESIDIEYSCIPGKILSRLRNKKRNVFFF